MSKDLFDRIGGGEFVLSVQIDPPNTADLAEFWRVVGELRSSGVNLIDVNSSRRMSCDSIQLSSAIAAKGFDVIPHVTTRDSSVNGLLNNIFAANLLAGIKNFLVITGDPYDATQAVVPSRGVYQTNSTGALRLINKHLRLDMKLDIFLGAAVNQNNDSQSEELAVCMKSTCGADFFMSQPVFSRKQADRLIDFYKRTNRAPMLVGIWPLVARRTIDAIKNGRVVGVVADDETCEESEQFEDETELANWGLDGAIELIKYVRDFREAAGVYIVAPSRNPLFTIPIIESIR